VTLHVDRRTLSLTQQVLYRQQGHAAKTSTYLTNHADIAESTGWLLSAFGGLSKQALTLATDAANTLAQLHVADALAVAACAKDMDDTDRQVREAFENVLTSFNDHPVYGPYVPLPGPHLGPAEDSAPDDYGHVPGMFIEKGYEAGKNVAGAVSDATELIKGVGEVHGVKELVDASSYLVPGQAPENPVSDLRWSAGALLGSIDWVAEQFLGFSILDRYIFHPFAGDWEGLFKASQSWEHAGDAMQAIAKNDAGLVSGTTTGWQGLSGAAFRGSATAMCAASYKLGGAYGAAGGVVHAISTACKLACVGIGTVLKLIVDKLLELAAEAATPVVGWIVGAFKGYQQVQDVIKLMRRIDLILETVANAINGFVDAKTDLVDALGIIEDLVKGGVTSVRAPA
jgi:hypothetical protein